MGAIVRNKQWNNIKIDERQKNFLEISFTLSFKSLSACVQNYYGFVNKSKANTRDFQIEAAKPNLALL